MCFRPPQVGKPKKCPQCGAMNPYTQTQCKKCKADLPEAEMPMFKCPGCGKENRADTDACDFCGMTVEEMVESGFELPSFEEGGGSAGLVALGVPKAPTAPGAPSAPKGPGASALPKAPTGPKA